MRALIPIRSAPAGPSIVPCPFCSTALVRRNHPNVPNVVAHVCPAHGAWIERSHILRLIGDIETDGLAALRAREKSRVDASAERKRSVGKQVEEMQRLMRRHVWFWFF